MDTSELQLTDEGIKEILERITPPVPISEDSCRIYSIAYSSGAAKAIRLCLRDVVRRDKT